MIIKKSEVFVPAKSFEQTVYVASDGKEFVSQYFCEKHERELNILGINFKDLDLFNNKVTIYDVKTQEEADNLYRFYDFIGDCENKFKAGCINLVGEYAEDNANTDYLFYVYSIEDVYEFLKQATSFAESSIRENRSKKYD